MKEDKIKEKFPANPIEKHDTAAWIANTKKTKPESNVPIPNEESVDQAKKWVDTNSLS